MILQRQLSQNERDTANDAPMRPEIMSAILAAVFGGAQIQFLSGIVPPTSGGGGTGAGTAGPGSQYTDTVGQGGLAVVYKNIGTLAAPTWAPIILGDSV